MVIFARARARFISSTLRQERDVDFGVVVEAFLFTLPGFNLLNRSPFPHLIRLFGIGSIFRKGSLVLGMLF